MKEGEKKEKKEGREKEKVVGMICQLGVLRTETKARVEEGCVQGDVRKRESQRGMKWLMIVLPDGELNCGVC